MTGRRFTATPGYAVLGEDKAARIASIAARWLEVGERNRQRLERERAKWQYETRESFVALATRLRDPRLKRPFYEVRTVTDIPELGQPAWGRGYSIDAATAELRFRLAGMFFNSGLCATHDEARERASKAEILVERSFAGGTQGVL